MAFRALLAAALCLQLGAAFPTSGYHLTNSGCGCSAPPPCVQVVEKPYPVLEQVAVPYPAPVPVPVIAPTITETTTRLAGTTSGNAAEQKVVTTSAPPPPVALPLPAPAPTPCGAPSAGAELIFNANAPQLALGAAPLALNAAPALGGLTLAELPCGTIVPATYNLGGLGLSAIPLASLGNGAIGLTSNGAEFLLPGTVPHGSLPVAATYSIPNSVALPPGLNLPSGISVPAGLSVPLGLPCAGQAVGLTL